jgi:hypothetical protein
MRSLATFVVGVALWQSAAMAQTTGNDPSRTDNRAPADREGLAAEVSVGTVTTPEYTPQTASERLRHYVVSSFGPEAFVMAAAAGGITQAENTPKEWGGGAKAYGERVGNSFAIHLIRTSLQYGASMALHEDNRYIPSTESGFFKRTKHVISSVFIAHNDAGGEHLAFSRIGSAAGASFISRAWAPHSTTSAGDGAVTFGITMATDIGFNFFREFGPKRFKRQ